MMLTLLLPHSFPFAICPGENDANTNANAIRIPEEPVLVKNKIELVFAWLSDSLSLFIPVYR